MVRRSAAQLGLFDPQLLARVVAQALRRPWWIPHYIDVHLAHARELLHSRLHLIPNHHVCRASLGRQRHVHGDILLIILSRIDPDSVNQPEVNYVDWNFRIVAIFERGKDFFLGKSWHKFSLNQSIALAISRQPSGKAFSFWLLAV